VVTARARLELLHEDGSVAAVERALRLPAGRAIRSFRLPLPNVRRRGYGLRLTVTDRAGRTLARADSAAEALAGWWESPRHACFTEFGPGRDPQPAASRLADWHVTVVQFYDWMWRHYRYEPPRGPDFLDPLGRRLSLTTVRVAVQACHRQGLAALAYGAVYGAESEYVERHPDEVLRDAGGRLLGLGGRFHIMDLRPSSAWRQRLLREYERACRRFGFDGIHMDTYGPPHAGIAADGSRVELDRIYPALIAEAAERLRRTDGHRRVLLNAVGGWPLEAVASAPAAASYLELWPPDIRYADLVRWVRRARRAAPGKAIVIAAYLSSFRHVGADPVARAGAVEAAQLLCSVLFAAGAYPHLLAEDDRLLVEGYYPAALPLRRGEAESLRAAWTFSARHVHLISDPDAREIGTEGVELVDARGERIPITRNPAAGGVWLRATELPDGRRVLQLVDLRLQANDRWDAIRQPSPPAVGWRIRLGPAASVQALSPWPTRDPGSATALLVPDDGNGGWVLPGFRRWLIVLPRDAAPPSTS
jgi:dextranase